MKLKRNAERNLYANISHYDNILPTLINALFTIPINQIKVSSKLRCMPRPSDDLSEYLTNHLNQNDLAQNLDALDNELGSRMMFKLPYIQGIALLIAYQYHHSARFTLRHYNSKPLFTIAHTDSIFLVQEYETKISGAVESSVRLQ